MQEKIKVALYCSGGLEKGFKVGYESLVNLMKDWNIELYHMNTSNPILSDFQEMSKKYKEGYKIITSGIPINSILASVSETDIIDPADITKKDPQTIFNKVYINKRELTINSDGLEFKCLPIWHPLYYIESKMQGGVANIVNTIRSYIGLTPTEEKKVLHSSRSSKELKEFIDRFVKDNEKFYVSYDIETNFVSPLMAGFSITGFSLAFSKDEGIYVVLNSSDFNMEEEERNKCLDLLKMVLQHPNSKVIVHNLKMEVPATLNEIDYEIPENKIEDTMVWSKLINSGKTGGNGLKEQAVYRLGYSDWSEDVDFINSIKSSIKKTISATDRKGHRKVEVSTFRSEELENLIKKYYPDNYLEVSRDLIDQIDKTDNIYSYGLIPAKILEKYGAIDAISTFELFFKYHELIIPINKKFNIDMEVGYELWLESMYASYLLELNSSRWDELQAGSDERAFTRIKEEDLRALLSSDEEVMKNHIMCYLRYSVMEKLFEQGEYTSDIESSPIFKGYTGTGKIRYENEDGKVKNINPDKYEDIMKIFNLSKNRLTVDTNIEYERLMQSKFSEWDIDKLTSVLNPNSDVGKKLIMSIIQDELIKSSKFILDVSGYVTSDTYQIDLANKEFNQGELELIDLIKQYNPNLSVIEKFELYESIMKKLGGINIGSKLSRMIVEAGDWEMSTLDEANMTELYNLYSIAGFDIDNDHDGDTPFARLFHIRRYKKTDKLVTTYIRGDKLGRSQVYVVDKKELQSGKKLVRRKRQYKPGEVISDDEDLVFQGSWAANSVLSGRWSSGIHTLPAWSDPKRYLSSRFKGGCSVIADFSQAEIRVVARASNEEHLLDAYAKGEDVHMKTAMNIFQKPASEISEVERRFSKMGTFHILYGGDPAGFANSYLNGDIAYANKIFEGFYGGYPKLKIWKDSKIAEVEEYGLVTTMTNRYIFLGHEQPGLPIDKIIRQSGNAPIQGPSSDIAASAVFNISDFIEKKNLKSKLYCFIHDSIEADVSPDELFYVMESFQYQMNNYPMERFKVPAKSDLTIGATLGEEVEVISYKPDPDYKGGYLHLEGNGDEVDRLLARWSEFWDTIDVNWIKRKTKYNSYRELFAVKRCFTRRIGIENSKVELEVRLRFTEGKGCKEKFPEYDDLFPLEKPLIKVDLNPYTEYKMMDHKGDDIRIYVDKDLNGLWKNLTNNSQTVFSFKSEDDMKDYIDKWKFVKSKVIGLPNKSK